MMDDDDFSEDDDDQMFLLDEEVPAHVSGRKKAGAKPAIRTKHHRIMKQTYKQTYKRRDDTRLSSSCPAKPLVGSLPIPELHNDMPALSLPATPASYDDGAKIISSLFTGCRVTGSSRKVFPRLSSSCPQYTSSPLNNFTGIHTKGKTSDGMPVGSPNSILSTSQTALSILQSSSYEQRRVRAASDVVLPSDSPPPDISLS